MKMEQALKQRLIGAVVLLAIAVIFLPVLFDRKHLEPIDTRTQIPPEPQIKQVVIEEPVVPEIESPAPKPEEMFEPEEVDEAPVIAEKPGLDSQGLVKSWVLQVASFRDTQHANALKRKLTAANYTAFSRESKFKNGTVFRVYVGPKLDKAELLRIKSKVDSDFNVSSLLLEFRPI